MIGVVALLKIPRLSLQEDEKVEGFETVVKLLKDKTVRIFFFGIFCYVGFEQGVSVWIATFLENYHQTDGAATTGLFWGMQAVGGLLGLLLMKLFDVKKVLGMFVLLAFVSLLTALYSSVEWALWAFPAVGFFTSVMYPSVFSLGLNSLSSHHGTFAGILCTGIIGGAIFPFLIGALGDATQLQTAMLLNVIALAYMFWIALKANPLVKNKTIF